MIRIDPNVSQMIDDLDFSHAVKRLQMPRPKGQGWSLAKTKDMIQRYRNYLKLISTGMQVSPFNDLDEVWHLHILDTETYTRDCMRLFGRYIHHYPYIGEGPGNEKVLPNIFAATARAYQEAFGEPYVPTHKE